MERDNKSVQLTLCVAPGTSLNFIITLGFVGPPPQAMCAPDTLRHGPRCHTNKNRGVGGGS